MLLHFHIIELLTRPEMLQLAQSVQDHANLTLKAGSKLESDQVSNDADAQEADDEDEDDDFDDEAKDEDSKKMDGDKGGGQTEKSSQEELRSSASLQRDREEEDARSSQRGSSSRFGH